MMNWDFVQGNWKQVAGKVKQQWGKLTDDDLAKIAGKREELEGKLQERRVDQGRNQETTRRFHDPALARLSFERNRSNDGKSREIKMLEPRFAFRTVGA